MNKHELKSWPDFFAATVSGAKPFDLRKDDRGYQVGDLVRLEEFRPGVGEYTGRAAKLRITFILRNFDGLESGYCILGYEEAPRP